MWRDPR
ncbi:hypothetical protein CISIN_1g0083742mg, partial [Citrus sinensis]